MLIALAILRDSISTYAVFEGVNLSEIILSRTITRIVAVWISSFLLGASWFLPAKAEEITSEVKLAVVGPATGDWAAWGAEMRNGAQLAVDDINAGGGINGQKIGFQFIGDEGSQETGRAIAQKLSKSGVSFVVGHYNSTSSISAAPVYAKAGVLMISPSTTNPQFTDSGLWNTFRTSGRDDAQGTFAGEYLAKNFSGRKIAVLHDGTPYGVGLAEKTKASLNAAGLKETMFLRAKFRGKGLSTLVSKLKSQNIEVVYFGGMANDLGALIRKSGAEGLEMQFVTGDGAAVGGLASEAGDGLEGTLMTFSLQDQARPDAQGIVQRLRAKGVEPIAYALKSYAAVQVIAKGAEVAKSNDPRAISSALRSGKAVPTILGELSFDEKGDRREPDVAMYEWQRQPSGEWRFYSMD